MSRGYLAEMLTMLTGAYNRRDIKNAERGRPMETNIGRLFSLIAGGFELVHEAAETVRSWDDLNNAAGTVLDRYGANFGVTRGAASDPLYRIFIQVKMIAQLSGGSEDAVINAASELLGVNLSDVLLNEIFPAKIALFVDQDLLSEERLDLIEPIAWAIKRTLAAGVGMRLYTCTYHTYRYDLPVGYGGAIGRFYLHQPVGGDKAFPIPVPITHGGLLHTTITGDVPDPKSSGIVRGSNRSGAYMHSYIKPKRID